MLLYFGGHTISANRIYGPQKLNGAIGLHLDTESNDRSKPGNVLPFSLFEIRTINETFTHVHGYYCLDQAASNVGKIRFTRRPDSPKIEHERRMTTLDSYFLLRT